MLPGDNQEQSNSCIEPDWQKHEVHLWAHLQRKDVSIKGVRLDGIRWAGIRNAHDPQMK